MTPHKQRFRHRPDEGVYGDCHRTAIACLLDLEPEQVPHFLHDGCDAEEFNRRTAAYLAEQGLIEIWLAYNCSLDELMQCLEVNAKGVYYLLGGRSRNGCNHTVIGCGGEIAWDPSLDDSGIVGPLSTGQFAVSFLVPMRFAKAVA